MNDLSHVELGQLVLGNPWGDHACPNWCDALIREILRAIGIVFWNKHQRTWDLLEDPCIPGIAYHPYYWGDEPSEKQKPNLACAGAGAVEVRWYKHVLRSSSLNVEAKPDVIIPWFNSVLTVISRADML